VEKRVPRSVLENNVEKRVQEIGIEDEASIPRKDEFIHDDS
jgi:hypothetical protein